MNEQTLITGGDSRQQRIAWILALGPVIPVVVIDRIEDAVPLAQALLAGGVTSIEVTLRSSVAMEAIRRLAAEVDGIAVGAGTVLDDRQLAEAEAAGADFAVSPGHTSRLLDAAADCALPLLPGAATASEAMTLRERGFLQQKFFPAEASGGAAFLKSLHGPLPDLRFCATGGIDAVRAREYMALPNVPCVGGSWLTPVDRVRAGDWASITGLARKAAG